MITSKNIGILLNFIKNSKKNSDLYLLVKKNSISLSSKRKSNFYIKNNNLESTINISKFYQSILNILLPILRKNKKLVIAQIGQSIDGRIALNNGNSHYINNPKSIIYLHCLRSISDAIIVGSNTIKKDDPLLTTRKIKGTNPKRIIIDGSLSLNNKYKIFNDGNENIIFTKSNKNIRLNNSTIIRLKEKNKLKYPLGSDEGKNCDKLGIWIEKTMYGKKYFGIDRSTFVINNKGKILNIWNKVKVKGHVEEVYNFCKGL